MKNRRFKAAVVAGTCAMALFVPTAGLAQATDEPDVTPKQGIMRTLDKYAHDYLTENLREALKAFSDRPDTTVLGTQENEIAIGKQQIAQVLMRAFQQEPAPTGIRYRVQTINHNREGTLGWVFTWVDVAMPAGPGGGPNVVSIRFTATLEKNPADGTWQFVQFHDSLPAGSFPPAG
ncbi:nuclear transport factor 2 family protein [Sphaerisporangium sp. B11E5]|uniref:nuclear transport factor 2 family protein n=1 Tax=Sphaerisporangium sp. B11E5 TaxID=3153563 RepID=UPI00325F0748